MVEQGDAILLYRRLAHPPQLQLLALAGGELCRRVVRADGGDRAVRFLDPVGLAGIGGKHVDHLAANRQLARLVHPVVGKIAKLFKLGREGFQLDRLAGPDQGGCGTEPLGRRIKPSGCLPRADQGNPRPLTPARQRSANLAQGAGALSHVGRGGRGRLAGQGVAGRAEQHGGVGGAAPHCMGDLQCPWLVRRQEQDVVMFERGQQGGGKLADRALNVGRAGRLGGTWLGGGGHRKPLMGRPPERAGPVPRSTRSRQLSNRFGEVRSGGAATCRFCRCKGAGSAQLWVGEQEGSPRAAAAPGGAALDQAGGLYRHGAAVAPLRRSRAPSPPPADRARAAALSARHRAVHAADPGDDGDRRQHHRVGYPRAPLRTAQAAARGSRKRAPRVAHRLTGGRPIRLSCRP